MHRIPRLSALLLAAAVLDPAAAATQAHSVAGFDEVVFDAAGELSIEQGPREALTVEAEPDVLRKVTAEVRGRRLHIAFAPGSRVETREPIRFRLAVTALRSLESRTAAEIHVGPLKSEALALVMAGTGAIRLDRLDGARSLDVRITGAGDVGVAGGGVTAQRLAIGGSGRYWAPSLASERAEVSIDGNGQAHLAARTALAVRIGGVGEVRFRGDPAVSRSIDGIGTVEKED
jgi:hypothetical protein